MNTLFTDQTIWAIERALTAASERQRVTSHNIANAVTPGFKAQRVDFEASLANALESDSFDAVISRRVSTEDGGLNGNNVSLEEESAELMRTEILYESLIAAENYKLGLIKSAIGS